MASDFTDSPAQKISGMLQELEDVLRSQQSLLQQRGLSLPAGTLSGISNTRDRLDMLTRQLHARQLDIGRAKALADTAAVINSSLALNTVLDHVIDTVIALIGAERGYIVLPGNDGKLSVRVARNLDQETIDKQAFIVSQSVVSTVAESGQSVITTNAQNDPRFSEQESVISYSLRSILCTPLKIQEKVIGVIYVDNRLRDGAFGEAELALLNAFAQQAAAAINNATLFEHVQKALADAAENRTLLENTVASIASGVIATDASDKIIICNQAASSTLGISMGSTLGQRLEAALPNLGQEFQERLDFVREQRVRESLEITADIPGRGTVILDLRISPLEPESKSAGGLTILINDLTAFRHRERILAEAQRYLPPAMVENIQRLSGVELSGEEREVSVVYADIRSFTGFSEKLQPEKLMTIINRYMEVASDAVHLYEGIVNRFIGDAVLSLFNTQLNPQQTDHALRAVRAAMSMIYDVRTLHELLPKEYRLWYGIGVDTGTAVLGNVGSEERQDFTAVGKPVVQAKQIQEIARPGEVLITEATYHQVHDRIEVERLQRTLPGETERVTIYRVTGFKRDP